MLRKLISVLLVFGFSHAVFAGSTQDTGHVNMLYGDATTGAIVIQLDGGFPNAVAAKQCAAADGSWAGNISASNTVKAMLLTAKATGASLIVTTQGCEGAWLKIVDVYMK
ncbi:hypothetical protein [Andreprevotia chitinilytica]|uniref:hypothetical protein n=1 Tax=Andreprevotia chitinilytica TaxID=396808 RepID=UPI000553D65B|nr:hypothetical protein [Andreprevotia chitinilytica]